MPKTTQQRTSGGGWKLRTKAYRLEQNAKAAVNRKRKKTTKEQPSNE